MGVPKPPIEFVKASFEAEGYILLDNIYINNHTKLNYVCPQGHGHSIIWSSWQQGKRCPYCNNNARIKIEDVKESMLKENYILLSNKYINAHTHLKYMCPKGHINKMTWSNWNHKRKFRCPQCIGKISKQEEEIQKFLLANNVDFISNDKTVLVNPLTNKALELDLWFSNKNKAIEFNGEYWHNKNERMRVDIIKQKLCVELGIELLIIFFKDYVENKERELSKILEFIQG